MFGSCFSKLFLRTIFENIDNTFLMCPKNCSCSLDIVIPVFSMFFNVFCCFPRSPCL